MANLIIQENGAARTRPAVMGEEITIKAPCSCSDVTGVQINGVVFPFYDAMGNSLGNTAGLFNKDSLIRVLIDVDKTRAYILNADTNAYLEKKFADKAPLSHTTNKSNPHGVTASQVGLGDVDNTSDADKPVSTAQAAAIADAKKAGTDAQANLSTHVGNKSNPHGVTKSQVGLGNVPNVATNDQTPTFTKASSLVNLVSGEKLAVSLGKVMKAIAELISHIGNKSNPHGVTADQAGAVPTSRTVNGKALSSNITLSASDVGAAATSHGNHVPATQTADNTKFLRNDNTWQQVTPANIGAVPTSRKVNGKSLSSSITLTAADVSAVPTSRTVNGRQLSSDITLSASDVGAVPAAGGTVTGALAVDGGVNTASVTNEDSSVNLYGKGSVGFFANFGETRYGMDLVVNDANTMYFRPSSTAARALILGNDSRRYNTIFLVNAANVTSDRNAKTDIQEIDGRFVALFDRLEPVSYKLVGENHDRNHLGFISQDVKAAMDELGISDLEFGGYCRDVKVDKNGEPIRDEAGNPIYSYSLRYGEFIALNSKMIQMNRATIQAQAQEIAELRAQVAELRGLITREEE